MPFSYASVRARCVDAAPSVNSSAAAAMYARSRGVGDPVLAARWIAARPSSICCGERSPAKGFPQRLSAMPQWAIAQEGSLAATPSNAAIACANQNECRSATARLKSCRSAGAHDVTKLTFALPVRSSPPAACSCWRADVNAGIVRVNARSAGIIFISTSAYQWPRSERYPTTCSAVSQRR